MDPFVEEDGKMAGISEKELTALVVGRLAGFAAHPDAVLFVGVANVNAARRVAKGEPEANSIGRC